MSRADKILNGFISTPSTPLYKITLEFRDKDDDYKGIPSKVSFFSRGWQTLSSSMGAERETEDLLRTLESIAGQGSRDCIGMLDKLRKVEMTPSTLSKTNAGKRLKALSKQKGVAEEVASLSKKIVGEWKAMVMLLRTTPTKSETGVTNLASERNASTNLTDGTEVYGDIRALVPEGGGEAPTPTGGMVGAGEGEADQPSQDDDHGGVTAGTATTVPEETGDALRDKIRTRLFDALCISRREGVASMDEGPLAGAIEKAMFETFDGTSAQYKTKFQQLHFNLKDARNPDLRRKMVLGGIDPKVLIHMEPEELASDIKREENQRIRDKKLFDAAPSQAKKATTDQFQCGKCRQRKCTYYQMQTRSAVGHEMLTRSLSRLLRGSLADWIARSFIRMNL